MTDDGIPINLLETGDRRIRLRYMESSDAEGILAFARRLPAHDLLFLSRDIRNPRVVDAWLEQIEQGLIRSLVALERDRIVGCNAMVRDELSWSPHVADIRILVSKDCRRLGLGRLLALHALHRARKDNLRKLTVRITPDQAGALKVFEEMGFRPEALLRSQVRDTHGETHDLVIMALDVERQIAQHSIYGL